MRGGQIYNKKMNGDQPESSASALEVERRDEARRLRRLQIMVDMVMSVIAQSEISLEEATALAAGARQAALAMFPGKELAYDLLYRPRLERLIRERFRIA